MIDSPGRSKLKNQTLWRELGLFLKCSSSLDKQRICVNMQLKSSKKQLKLNVCVPKSNSVYRYSITCAVIAYRLVHFVSICVIYKCQSARLAIDRSICISTRPVVITGFNRSILVNWWSIGPLKKLGWCEDTLHYLSLVLLNSIKTKSSLI